MNKNDVLSKVKNLPFHIWIMLAGLIVGFINFDFGVILFVTGIFIWVYNRGKSDQTKSKKKLNKNSFKINTNKVIINGKVQDKPKNKKKRK